MYWQCGQIWHYYFLYPLLVCVIFCSFYWQNVPLSQLHTQLIVCLRELDPPLVGWLEQCTRAAIWFCPRRVIWPASLWPVPAASAHGVSMVTRDELRWTASSEILQPTSHWPEPMSETLYYPVASLLLFNLRSDSDVWCSLRREYGFIYCLLLKGKSGILNIESPFWFV